MKSAFAFVVFLIQISLIPAAYSAPLESHFGETMPSWDSLITPDDVYEDKMFELKQKRFWKVKDVIVDCDIQKVPRAAEAVYALLPFDLTIGTLISDSSRERLKHGYFKDTAECQNAHSDLQSLNAQIDALRANHVSGQGVVTSTHTKATLGIAPADEQVFDLNSVAKFMR